MAKLLPGLRPLIRRSRGIADRAVAAALAAVEDWADELTTRLAKLEETAGGASLPIAQSDVTGLVSALAAKVPTSRTISTTAPLTGGGALSGDLTLGITLGGIYNTLLLGSGGNPVAQDLDFDGVSVVVGLTPSGGVYVLTREVQARNITVQSGVVIRTDGHRILATGTLTVNGTIHYNGSGSSATPSGGIYASNLAGSTTAAGANSTSIPDFGWNGNSGAANAGAAATNGTDGGNEFRGGGGGGSLTAGGNSGGSSLRYAANMGGTSAYDLWVGHPARVSVTTAISSGSGGGAGGLGASGVRGVGGSGGGIVGVACGALTGSGSIEARGANGGNGTWTCGGGGGGGGGLIVLFYGTRTGSVTINTAGGTGGTGAGGGGNGGNGGSGVAMLVNLSGDGT
jgi:hypothetical protein